MRQSINFEDRDAIDLEERAEQFRKKKLFWLRIIISILEVVLVLYMTVEVVADETKMNKRYEFLCSLEEEGRPYELEKADIIDTLRKEKYLIYQNLTKSYLHIGFLIRQAKDVELVEEMHELYGVNRILVVLVDEPLDDINSLLDALDGKPFELIMMAMEFDDDALANAKEFLDTYSAYGYFANTVPFLLRGVDDTSDNIRKILGAGFPALIRYSNDMISGVIEEDVPYFAYGFLNDSDDIYYFLSQLNRDGSALLFVMDPAEKETGDLTDKGLKRVFDYWKMFSKEIQTNAALTSTFDSILLLHQNNIQRQMQYDALEEELVMRMEELNRTLDTIYGRWNDYIREYEEQNNVYHWGSR